MIVPNLIFYFYSILSVVLGVSLLGLLRNKVSDYQTGKVSYIFFIGLLKLFFIWTMYFITSAEYWHDGHVLYAVLVVLYIFLTSNELFLQDFQSQPRVKYFRYTSLPIFIVGLLYPNIRVEQYVPVISGLDAYIFLLVANVVYLLGYSTLRCFAQLPDSQCVFVRVTLGLFSATLAVLTVVLFSMSIERGIIEELLYLLSAAILVFLSVYSYFVVDHFNVIELRQREKLDPEFQILNLKGFSEDASDIRQICSRLNQGVTLAVFEISCRQTADQQLEFRIRNEVVTKMKFALRKHDLFCRIEGGVFAILLPFTDEKKGKQACVRLHRIVFEDLVAEGSLTREACVFRFGLSVVYKNEVNVLDAVKRSIKAMFSVDQEKDIVNVLL